MWRYCKLETCSLPGYDRPNCPSGWQLTGYSKRTCCRVSTGQRTCDSVFFGQVCGGIRAYQYGLPDEYVYPGYHCYVAMELVELYIK